MSSGAFNPLVSSTFVPSSSAILPISSSVAVPSSSSIFIPSSTAFPSLSSNSVPALAASSSSFTANLTVTTHLPLTTIFTAPASCTDIPYVYSEFHSGLSTFWRDRFGPAVGANSACYPYSFYYQHRPTVQADYSPGVCPSGYAAASSVENPIRGAWTSWCCSSGMSYAAEYGCYSIVTTSTAVNLNPRRTVTMIEPFVAVDWAIKVAWATSELDLFTPASAPLLSGTDAPESPIGGMSESMRSALQVGIPVSVVTIAVVAVACYALWRRKRRRHKQPSLMTEDDKEWSDDQERLRDDSTQPQESSDDTSPNTNTDSADSRSDARQCFTAVRQDSWQFDETEPAMEPR